MVVAHKLNYNKQHPTIYKTNSKKRCCCFFCFLHICFAVVCLVSILPVRKINAVYVFSESFLGFFIVVLFQSKKTTEND